MLWAKFGLLHGGQLPPYPVSVGLFRNCFAVSGTIAHFDDGGCFVCELRYRHAIAL
jgi:hypothetical protein